MDIRQLKRGSFTEYYVTASAEPDASGAESARRLFSDLAVLLEKEGIQVIQEKIYGKRELKTQVLEIRRASFSKGSLEQTEIPVTYLEGAPVNGAEFGGFQLWGIAPHDLGKKVVTTFPNEGLPSGRLWNEEDFQFLYIPAVTGISEDGTLPEGASQQAQRMFSNAGALLKAAGYSFGQVFRTWIYMARILDWYDNFNQVRTAFFEQEEIRRPGSKPLFPASTGIQAKSRDEECLMDLLALNVRTPGKATLKPVLQTSQQGGAFSYGSAFSRAMVLEMEGRRTVYLSGTASIDAAGETVFPDDPKLQCEQTLRCAAAVLEEQGGSLEDICSATIFFKTREVFQTYEKISRQPGFPRFPAISVIADVCRPDLLVEIEAVAII